MGRGRAKAKQQKVARELKYNSHTTDFASLQRELGGGVASESPRPSNDDDDADEYEPSDEDGWAQAR